MPYVIMVYASDEDEADKIFNQHRPDREGSRAVGMYELPSKHDETCNGCCHKVKGKLNGWSRHPEDGYIVHECGLPHKDRRSRIRTTLLDVLGINLLARSITPPLFQNPEGWGG